MPATAPVEAEELAPPATPEQLLVRSLVHSARSLTYFPESASPPARGARLIAQTHAAAQLDPKDLELNVLLAQLLELQGDYARAAEAVRVQLEHNATSSALGLSYLALGQMARETLAERVAFLQTVAADVTLPPYTRGEALANLGNLYMDRGDRELAAQSYADALELDDQLFSALFGQFSLMDRENPVVRASGLLGLLRSSPVYAGGAIELGALLREQGLAGQAAYFYMYGWRLATREKDGAITEELATLATHYFDAMLDAGQYRQAIELMHPVMGRLRTPGWEMYCQLMEAYAGVNDMHKLAETRSLLLKAMNDRETAMGKLSPEELRQMAWYFLVSDAIIKDDRRLYSIRDYAGDAMKGLKGIPEDDPTIRLVRAVVRAKEAGRQLLSGKLSIEEFNKQLEDLAAMAPTEPYAAYFLAEQLYLAADNKTRTELKPAEVLSQGMRLMPYGRPMRLMRQMADRHNVPVPKLGDQAKIIGDNVGKWLETHQPLVEMALLPEKHVRVLLRPTATTFEALGPIEIEVHVQNISKVDIPLGPSGLFNPVVTFRVIAESRGVKGTFDNLPSAVLPAPRVLKAGTEVVTTTRIDMGEFEEYLYRRPLDTISCIVGGTLDPVQRDRKVGTPVSSSLPTVAIDRTGFVRTDILGENFDRSRGDWTEPYRKMLQYTVNDFQNGTLERRMSAARVIGSLLTVANDAATRRMAPPPPLLTAVEAPMLLSMFRAILKDADVVVRQEALWALMYCKVDGKLVTLMEPAFKDADPVVRLRAMDVIGTARPPEFRRILERFADDKDPMVQVVIRALRDQNQKNQTK